LTAVEKATNLIR